MEWHTRRSGWLRGLLDVSTSLDGLKTGNIVNENIRVAHLVPTLLKDGLQILNARIALTTDQLMEGNSPEGKEVIERLCFPGFEKSLPPSVAAPQSIRTHLGSAHITLHWKI